MKKLLIPLMLLSLTLGVGATCGSEKETPTVVEPDGNGKGSTTKEDPPKNTIGAHIYEGIDLSVFSQKERAAFVEAADAELCPCEGIETSLHSCLKSKNDRCDLAMRGASRLAQSIKMGKTKTDALNELTAYFEAAKATYEFRLKGVPFKGNPDAKVIIVEFADFECPACAGLAKPMKDVAAKYGDKIGVYFKNYPLSFHKHAKPAAYAALAAHKQGKFWEMHDLLFENQRALGPDMIKSLSNRLGLNFTKLQEDMGSKEIQAQVQADLEDGERTKLDGTPTVFINGKRYMGSYEKEDMIKFIDGLLAAGDKKEDVKKGEPKKEDIKK